MRDDGVIVNGDNDRPDAFKEFSITLEKNGIEQEILILPDTKHNLGLYYERSVGKLLAFLGKHLKKLEKVIYGRQESRLGGRKLGNFPCLFL